MTYRERRERRAERLADWADKREEQAAAVRQSQEVFRGDHAFNFQPANPGSQLHRMRQRLNAQAERAFESSQKAQSMSSRAAGIERQLDSSIYSDDPDAVERLRERIAALESERETVKAENAAFRKAHGAELRGMTAYQRGQALPHPPYVLTNLGGNIKRNRDRLARLEREAEQGPPDRIILARFSSSCETCGAELVKGSSIRYNRQAGARCVDCPA